MDQQQKEEATKPSSENKKSEIKKILPKKCPPKKIKKVIKSTKGGTKTVKKIEKAKTIESVKPQMIKQNIPTEMTYNRELPVQNIEHVNKEYQLKDIVNKTQTTVNYHKALSTTIVRPIIVQEVVTRKPIIAPMDIKTPVNFFEGQPLSSEDLIIQNFFKNTTPLMEATNQNLQNSYLFNGNNYIGQTVQYPKQQQYNFYNNYNYLSQSVQIPNNRLNIVENGEISQNLVRPQVEEVQKKKVKVEEFKQQKEETMPKKPISNVKVVKKQPVAQVKKTTVTESQMVVNQGSATKNKELKKSLKPQEKIKNITVNNVLKATYPAVVQQKKVEIEEQKNEDEEEKMPRDSIRIKK